MFDYWLQRQDKDKWNYATRDASCEWVADPLDFLETFMPPTYPHVAQSTENHYTSALCSLP